MRCSSSVKYSPSGTIFPTYDRGKISERGEGHLGGCTTHEGGRSARWARGGGAPECGLCCIRCTLTHYPSAASCEGGSWAHEGLSPCPLLYAYYPLLSAPRPQRPTCPSAESALGASQVIKRLLALLLRLLPKCGAPIFRNSTDKWRAYGVMKCISFGAIRTAPARVGIEARTSGSIRARKSLKVFHSAVSSFRA